MSSSVYWGTGCKITSSQVMTLDSKLLISVARWKDSAWITSPCISNVLRNLRDINADKHEGPDSATSVTTSRHFWAKWAFSLQERQDEWTRSRLLQPNSRRTSAKPTDLIQTVGAQGRNSMAHRLIVCPLLSFFGAGVGSTIRRFRSC